MKKTKKLINEKKLESISTIKTEDILNVKGGKKLQRGTLQISHSKDNLPYMPFQ